jgi:nitroimidazol reductase NimA-like FMN-containing flavoprotein (pyridoxamine 5'-phosphate oxidase superfamily)
VTSVEPILEPLTRAECLVLLASASFGRVGVTIGAMPAILPVNYLLFDEDIVFRTSPGTKLSAAVREAVVAFEVDQNEATDRTGWSVLVVGTAREIVDGPTQARVQALGLEPWADGQRDHYIRVASKRVTGRRIIR